MALLRIAQAGDRDAFGHLYACYSPQVRRYVWVRMRDWDRDAVPDLVQEAFVAALEELDRAPEDVEGWLLQLAARACTRHSWGRRRYLRAGLTWGEHERSRATSDSNPVPRATTTVLVAAALAGLDPRERLTLQLRFLDGQRRETTAQILGCSLWTVKRWQRRGLRRLAAGLDARQP